jgi:NADPH-dependent glutamate synthase beta subunit-like oxidoreductase
MKTGTFGELPQAVAVLGGGNTAIDAAVTAKRAGARDVYIVYRRSFAEMPAWPNERDEALEEGVHFLILTQPLDYVAGEDGALAGLKVASTRLGEPDATGRRSPEQVEGSERVLPVEMAIEAIGQRPPADLADWATGIELTRQGLISVDEATMQTSREGAYAGGDIVNGGQTVVQAVAEGLKAAQAISVSLGK